MNVLTYGTFDMFHIGHLNMLKRAKSMGERLYVGVSTDEFNRLKGKKTLIPFEERKEIVSSIKYVDVVFAEETWDQKIEDIKRYHIDVFVMGEDWKGKFDYLNEYCKVVYLPRTEGISTTNLKENLKAFYNLDIEGLKKAMETIQAILKSFE